MPPLDRPNGLGYVLDLRGVDPSAAGARTEHPPGPRREETARAFREIGEWVRDQAIIAHREGLDLTAIELEQGADAIGRFAEELEG